MDEIYSTNGVADPGSGAFLTPGSGVGEISGSGFGMNNQDHISESLETIFRLKCFKNFYANLGSLMEKVRIWNGKNSSRAGIFKKSMGARH